MAGVNVFREACLAFRISDSTSDVDNEEFAAQKWIQAEVLH